MHLMSMLFDVNPFKRQKIVWLRTESKSPSGRTDVFQEFLQCETVLFVRTWNVWQTSSRGIPCVSSPPAGATQYDTPQCAQVLFFGTKWIWFGQKREKPETWHFRQSKYHKKEGGFTYYGARLPSGVTEFTVSLRDAAAHGRLEHCTVRDMKSDMKTVENCFDILLFFK